MRKWNWNESRMQCKFYWQIGKHFFFLNFFLNFFLFFFNSFFWLTHELNLALFKLVFFLLTLCGAFRIWKFCDFACIFFMFSFDFTVIYFFSVFFFFFVFSWYCLVLVNFEFQIRVRQIRLVIFDLISIGYIFWFDLKNYLRLILIWVWLQLDLLINLASFFFLF